MFMQQQSGNDCNENVYCFVNEQQPCNPCRYRSCFSAKVRWDSWLEKTGCCKSIGPPPKLGMQCPVHFLRKHSRQVPVFFRPGELRVTRNKDYLKRFIYEEPLPPKKESRPLDTGRSGRTFRPGNNADDGSCPFPRPPSRLGLFRSNKEPSYEQKYIINKPQAEECECDFYLWHDYLLQATQDAGIMAGRMGNNKGYGGRNGGGGGEGGAEYKSGGGPFKDFIRANAVKAIRMPPRRLRRCYVDPCGVHLIDMSDSPYVLRPGFGKVPAYLCRRKMQLLQEDMEAKRGLGCDHTREGDDIQMVNEDEKELVIKGLKDYWADLLNQYNSLPLDDSGNERQREMKHDLEERMKEVESDLRMLTSTSTLFVGDVKESRYL